MNLTKQQYNKIANLKSEITDNIAYWMVRDHGLLQQYAARLVRTDLKSHLKSDLGVTSFVNAPKELYKPICDLLNSYRFRYANKEYQFSKKPRKKKPMWLTRQQYTFILNRALMVRNYICKSINADNRSTPALIPAALPELVLSHLKAQIQQQFGYSRWRDIHSKDIDAVCELLLHCKYELNGRSYSGESAPFFKHSQLHNRPGGCL